jgi:hypothetical protein
MGRTFDEQLAGTASLIQQDLNRDIAFTALHDLVIRQSRDAQLFERVVRVRYQLAEKDILVRV